nr:FAD:protein FMN transferase [Paenibacillus alba]
MWVIHCVCQREFSLRRCLTPSTIGNFLFICNFFHFIHVSFFVKFLLLLLNFVEVVYQRIKVPYQIIDTIEVSNEAVCTSGGYERKSKVSEDIHHIIYPKSKQSPHVLNSGRD